MSFLEEQKWHYFEVPEVAENHFLQMMMDLMIFK